MTTPEKTRNMSNWIIYTASQKVVPMFFFWDFADNTIQAKIRSWKDEETFRVMSDSAKILDDDLQVPFASLDDEIKEKLELFKTSAYEVTEWDQNAIKLDKIFIDCELLYVRVEGKNEGVGGHKHDHHPDEKFEELKARFPELVLLFNELVLRLFCKKTGSKQAFYQQALDQHLTIVEALENQE